MVMRAGFSSSMFSEEKLAAFKVRYVPQAGVAIFLTKRREMVNTLNVYNTYENCKFARKNETRLIDGTISAISITGDHSERRMLIGCKSGGTYYTLSRAIVNRVEVRPDAFEINGEGEPVLIPAKIEIVAI